MAPTRLVLIYQQGDLQMSVGIPCEIAHTYIVRCFETPKDPVIQLRSAVSLTLPAVVSLTRASFRSSLVHSTAVYARRPNSPGFSA